MALLPCYECGTSISTAADSCPNCGAPNKMKVSVPASKVKPDTRPIFKLIAWLLLCFFLYAWFSRNDATPPAAIPEGPAVSVDADQLALEYRNNEVSADEKYKGKRLIVAGVVQSINKDFKDEVWVGLRTDNQFMPIHAEGLTAAQAGVLKKGDVIAIICTGEGMTVGSPFLKNCRPPNKTKK